MSDRKLQDLPVLYALCAGFSAIALAFIGVYTYLGGFSCH